MDIKNTDLLMQRVNKIMNERYLKKKDVAERLGMEYLAFWRRLNGKRGIDIVFLSKLANVLGTSVSYLMGETDNNTVLGDIKDSSSYEIKGSKLPIDVLPAFNEDGSKEMLHQETLGHLKLTAGKYCIDIPDTPANQAWFTKLTENLLIKGITIETSS